MKTKPNPLVLCALIFCSLFAFAEKPVIVQKTYLKAQVAKLIPKEDHVLIVVEKLDQSASYGIEITSDAPSIEVWKLVTVNGQTFATFPPTTLKPDSPKTFNLTGNKGDRFGLSFRSEEPYWEEVIIAGEVKPTPAPGDFSGITKVAKDEADKLNDPVTRKALSTAFKEAIKLTTDKSLDDCKLIITNARRITLQLRNRQSQDKDWESWKLAVDKVLNASSKEAYIKSYEAIIAGLDQ